MIINLAVTEKERKRDERIRHLLDKSHIADAFFLSMYSHNMPVKDCIDLGDLENCVLYHNRRCQPDIVNVDDVTFLRIAYQCMKCYCLWHIRLSVVKRDPKANQFMSEEGRADYAKKLNKLI